MNQLYDWLSMGGYAMYVWPAYGLVTVVFILNVVAIKWQKNKMRRTLQQWFKAQVL